MEEISVLFRLRYFALKQEHKFETELRNGISSKQEQLDQGRCLNEYLFSFFPLFNQIPFKLLHCLCKVSLILQSYRAP